MDGQCQSQRKTEGWCGEWGRVERVGGQCPSRKCGRVRGSGRGDEAARHRGAGGFRGWAGSVKAAAKQQNDGEGVARRVGG